MTERYSSHHLIAKLNNVPFTQSMFDRFCEMECNVSGVLVVDCKDGSHSIFATKDNKLFNYMNGAASLSKN